MIAAIGTLVFLGTLWVLVVVGAAVLGESGAKIAAALKGKPVLHTFRVASDPSEGATAYARWRAVARRRLTAA